jgi:hypothetical protein
LSLFSEVFSLPNSLAHWKKSFTNGQANRRYTAISLYTYFKSSKERRDKKEIESKAERFGNDLSF